MNVRAEKTSENCFYQAMCSAVQKSGIQMVDYCCTESVMVDKVMPGRMIIFYDLFLLLFKIREQIFKKKKILKHCGVVWYLNMISKALICTGTCI